MAAWGAPLRSASGFATRPRLCTSYTTTRDATPLSDRAALIDRLRTLIAQREGARPLTGTAVSLAPEIDAVLPAAGLARGTIHEVLAGRAGPGTAFCALVLGRAGGPAIWIEDRPELYPHGTPACGLDPAALIVVRASGVDALWAAEEALRCPVVTAVAAVLPRLDLVSQRRLQLAAEAGDTLGLILHLGQEEACRPHSAGSCPMALFVAQSCQLFDPGAAYVAAEGLSLRRFCGFGLDDTTPDGDEVGPRPDHALPFPHRHG